GPALALRMIARDDLGNRAPVLRSRPHLIAVRPIRTACGSDMRARSPRHNPNLPGTTRIATRRRLISTVVGAIEAGAATHSRFGSVRPWCGSGPRRRPRGLNHAQAAEEIAVLVAAVTETAVALAEVLTAEVAAASVSQISVSSLSPAPAAS